MNNFAFEKTMENIIDHKNIKLVTIYKKRNQLIKNFSDNLMTIT